MSSIENDMHTIDNCHVYFIGGSANNRYTNIDLVLCMCSLSVYGSIHFSTISEVSKKTLSTSIKTKCLFYWFVSRAAVAVAFISFIWFDFVLMSKKTLSIESLSWKIVFSFVSYRLDFSPFIYFSVFLYALVGRRNWVYGMEGGGDGRQHLIPFNTKPCSNEKNYFAHIYSSIFRKFQGKFKRLIQLPIIILFAIDISVSRKAAQFRIEWLWTTWTSQTWPMPWSISS